MAGSRETPGQGGGAQGTGRRRKGQGEAAKGEREQGVAATSGEEGKEGGAARVWGGWCLPPFLAGHYEAKWAKAQAQVAGKSQKTPFKLLIKRFSERTLSRLNILSRLFILSQLIPFEYFWGITPISIEQLIQPRVRSKDFR